MAARKQGKPRVGRRSGAGAPSATALGRMELLLEAMRDENRLAREFAINTRGSLERRITELKSELSARMDALESVLRFHSQEFLHVKAALAQNSEDIRKNTEDIRKNTEDIRKNSDDIRRMEAAVQAMRQDLAVKADAADLRRLEDRVAALEKRLAS